MNNLILKLLNGKNIGRWFYHGKEVFSNDGGKTFIIDDRGNYVLPGVNKSLVRADRVISNAYRSGNNWFHIGSGQKVTKFKNTTPSNNQLKSIASTNSLKSQTSLKVTPKISQSSTTVVNNQQKRNVPSTSAQPKSSRSNTLVRNTNGIISKPLYTRAYKQRVSDLGLKDVDAVKAIQRLLGVNDDGIWGDITEKAYMAKVQGDRFSNPDVLKPVSKPSYYIPTVGTIDERGNITLNNPNVTPVPRYNNFLNLNTLPKLQDSINKPLSLLTFAKKGSKLVSRNPIERFQQGKTLPIAPKVEDRYRNGYKYGYRADGSVYLFPNPFYTIADIKGVRTNHPFMSNLGEIKRTVFYAGDSPMDTVYTETPNSVFPVKIKLRYANSKNKTPEYEILKRRFNTAWNLAK